MIGDGLEKEKLENTIKEQKIEDTFFMLGRKDNPFPYVKKADLFIHLIKFAFRLVCHTGDSKFKSDEDYKRLGLTGPLIALKELYAEPVGKSSKKVLEQMGFSEMDILNLNCGIWLIKDQKPYCCNSEIKWWRLKKRWFQSLFVQKEEITINTVIEKMIEDLRK